MMPSCDQTGVPIHFHSSTTFGSASLMSLRILLRVCPRQSASSLILFEMSSDAGWSSLAPDFFMFSSWKSQTYFICMTAEDSHVSWNPLTLDLGSFVIPRPRLLVRIRRLHNQIFAMTLCVY